MAWERRDVRDLPWQDEFDAALNWFGSSGYFDHKGNQELAAAVARALTRRKIPAIRPRPGDGSFLDARDMYRELCAVMRRAGFGTWRPSTRPPASRSDPSPSASG